MAAVQSCPALKYPPIGDVLGRVFQVGIVEDETGAFPPSSRWVRLRSAAAAGATSYPARVDAGDRHHRRDRVDDHRAAGVAVPAHDVEDTRRQELGGDLGEQRELTGVVSLGLSTTQLPAASAGATFQIAIIIG